MKKRLFILIAALVAAVLIQGCASKKEAPVPQPTARVLTKELACEGVSNYCHSAYDWSAAESDPSLMYVTPGEETEDAYQVIFRSYTGAFVYFQVDKASGIAGMTEVVPAMNIEADAGSINVYDYLS